MKTQKLHWYAQTGLVQYGATPQSFSASASAFRFYADNRVFLSMYIVELIACIDAGVFHVYDSVSLSRAECKEVVEGKGKEKQEKEKTEETDKTGQRQAPLRSPQHTETCSRLQSSQVWTGRDRTKTKRCLISGSFCRPSQARPNILGERPQSISKHQLPVSSTGGTPPHTGEDERRMEVESRDECTSRTSAAHEVKHTAFPCHGRTTPDSPTAAGGGLPTFFFLPTPQRFPLSTRPSLEHSERQLSELSRDKILYTYRKAQSPTFRAHLPKKQTATRRGS